MEALLVAALIGINKLQIGSARGVVDRVEETICSGRSATSTTTSTRVVGSASPTLLPLRCASSGNDP